MFIDAPLIAIIQIWREAAECSKVLTITVTGVDPTGKLPPKKNQKTDYGSYKPTAPQRDLEP